MQKTHEIQSEKKERERKKITLVVSEWHDFNAR